LNKSTRAHARRGIRWHCAGGKGPDSSFDPAEPNENKRVLCPDQYCSRYIVGTCGQGEVSTGTNHLGFRCVKDKVDKRAHAATTKVLLPKPFLLKES